MTTVEALIAQIEEAGERYARFIETQSNEAFHRRPGADEWTAAEITGHVSEFPTTFAEQAHRLSQDPSFQLGRQLNDPGRLAAVARLAGAGPAEAAAMVRAGVAQAVSTLRGIPADGWQVRGQHPRYGEVSVADVAERHILNHLREHLEQARAATG